MRADEKTGRGSSARAIVGLGLPMLVGAVAATMSGAIDTAMIGHYSAHAAIAVSGATTIFDILANVIVASIIGHQILAARFAGAGQPGGIRESVRATTLFSGGLAVGGVVMCAVAGTLLTGLVTGAQPQLERIGAEFLLTSSPTLLLLVPYNICSAVINAYKRARLTMLISVLVNLVNLGLDRLLIYGAGPFPALGAAGSGLATTFSWAVGLVLIIAVAARLGLIANIRRAIPVSNAGFETSVPKLAWPAVTSMGLDYLSTAVFFAVVGSSVGADALAGGRIAFQVMIVMFGVLGAFSSGTRVLVGRALGEGEASRARVLWRSGQRVIALLAIPVAVVLVAVPGAIASMFTSFPQLQNQAEDAIRVIGACLPAMALTLGNVSVLRALGKTRWDMYANVLAATCVQLPMCCLLTLVFHLGVAGAFGGVAGYWLARGIVAEIFARRCIGASRLSEPTQTVATAGAST
jgi:MATE family multidrug resistance protein